MFTKKMSVKMKHLLHLSMKIQDCEHENKIKTEGKEKLFKQRSAEFLEEQTRGSAGGGNFTGSIYTVI